MSTAPAPGRERAKLVHDSQKLDDILNSSMGGKIVRTIGIARARLKIGVMNLGYNIHRLIQIEWAAAAPASVGRNACLCGSILEMGALLRA
jgi:hypothetical protein